MTNKEKALALIETFANGDTVQAKALLTDYLQLCRSERTSGI